MNAFAGHVWDATLLLQKAVPVALKSARPGTPEFRSALRDALLGGERKIDRWTARFGCAVHDWPAEPLDPFFNANAPDDLAAAEEILLRRPVAPPIGKEERTKGAQPP